MLEDNTGSGGRHRVPSTLWSCWLSGHSSKRMPWIIPQANILEWSPTACETVLPWCGQGEHTKEHGEIGGACICLFSQTCICSRKSQGGAMIVKKGKSLGVPAHCMVNTTEDSIRRYPRQLKWISSRAGSGQVKTAQPQEGHHYPQGMSPLLRLLQTQAQHQDCCWKGRDVWHFRLSGGYKGF